MLRNALFAMVPMVLAVSFARADDSLPDFNLAEIQDAEIEIDAAGLDDLDVDELASEAGADSEDAIEACFRRFGYRRCGYGHHYSFRCYRPCYRYFRCHPSYYCYRPIYHYSYPVVRYVSYWGCY